MQDLSNKIFGNFTVLSFGEKRKQLIYWKCQCKCGNIKLLQSHDLKANRTKSCGCLWEDTKKEQIGKISGNLTITAFALKKIK